MKITKKNRKRLVSSVTILAMACSLLSPVSYAAIGSNQGDVSGPSLLITELVPDSSNVSSSDAYEFIEVYNNSSETINFKDYDIVYRYPDKGPDYDAVWSSGEGDILIPSHTSVVFWVMNSVNQSLTADDFNQNYSTSLQENVNLFRVNGGGGMANGSPRDILIKDKSGSEIIIASYQNDDQTKPNQGIFYHIPTDGSIQMVMGSAGLEAATPGTVDPAQLSAQQVSEPPVISHTPVTQADLTSDLMIQAEITNAEGAETVTAYVYYKADSQSDYTSLDMTPTGDSQYEAIIPKEALTGSLQYYIEAQDGENSVDSDVYSVDVQSGGEDQTPPVVDFSKLPALLVTELAPDSTNVEGVSSDAYEFIEVYNNTDETVNFKNYQLIYRYTNRNPVEDTLWSTGEQDILIPSQQSVVFWIINSANGAKTEADFNANYASNLVEGQNLFRIYNDGMSNAGPRGLIIKDANGNEISGSYYENDDQTKANQGIFYSYPVDGGLQTVVYSAGTEAATPGVVDPAQVPEQPVHLDELPVNQPPTISHTPVNQGDSDNDLTLTAEISNAESEQTVTAKVFYKTESQSTFQSVDMVSAGGSSYQAVISKDALTESSLQYYIQASDGVTQVDSDTYTVLIGIPDFDPQKVSPLLVTEVVPDSTNVGSADGYEFIEIYNNSDQPVNFKDYKIHYRYTASGPDADLIWPGDKEDVIIPSKGTLVFWIINSQNTEKTVADFNANYNTNLVEGQDIVKIYSDGMANGGGRGITIATNTGTEISAAYYDNNEETQPDKGIFYKFPVDGSTNMIKYSAGLDPATPGAVDAVQVPEHIVHVDTDTVQPTYTDVTNRTQVDQSKNLEIIGDAQDDQQVKTVTLYYKTDRQEDYIKQNLVESFADTMYHHIVYSPELIGNAYVEYYFVISDGTNEITSEMKRVSIVGGMNHSDLRLNLQDGEFVSGTKVIKGTGEGLGASDVTLKIDDQVVSDSTYPALEKDAYFAFDVSGVNYYFKNAVTVGQEILFTFQDPINSYETLSIPIAAERLKEGSNVISIRAGSKAGPFDDRVEENKDDFTVKNVRLVLADGTVIYDPAYADPTSDIKMGDSAGKYPVVDFNFHLPLDKLSSKTFAWDTTTLSDGDHAITIHSSAGTLTHTVKVDNTAPVIQPTVEEGHLYRGSFTLDAEVSDAGAGVESIEVTLDEQAITLPYETSSAQLTAGEHVLTVKAVDQVGNEATQTIHFQVPAENPEKPELVSPVDGATGVNRTAPLTVNVTDPTNDDLKVSFFKGFNYDASKPNEFKGYRNAADTEPPKVEKPEGEVAMEAANYAKIGAKDGDYLIDDAVNQFPYQRFEITLDDSVKSSDQVDVIWQGKSLEGRKVSLYAWDPSAQEWKPLNTRIAGSEDFELKATVKAGEFATDGKIDVMVQDEIPATSDQYDFSFVWMSDTQYYSESYPYIYQDIVQWIADHKEDNKIKYVIHTGDIVDEADKEYQWVEADKDMKVLEDANIPYGVLAGNHDVGHQTNDYQHYWKWFGEDRFKDQSTYGESYDNNRGHYDLVSSNGNDFIVIYMGWGFGNQEIDWINEVLKKYPERKAILNFHEYLLVSGNRAPLADKVYEQVVVPNKNVIAVLSGHYHDAELKMDPIDDNGDGQPDRNVYQMLADYQGAPEGGLGYIRLMQFDMENNKINMKTFSPYLQDENFYDTDEYPGKDEFTIDLNLQPVTKRVATDFIGVKVYTDQLIGSVDDVKSGQQAKVNWTGLGTNAAYEWYAAVEDDFGGKTLSDIWNFSTGNAGPSTGSHSSGSNSSGSTPPPAGTVSAENGGSVQQQGAQVDIPAGAMSGDDKIIVKIVTDTGYQHADGGGSVISKIYEITKEKGRTFDKPVTITLPFDKSKVDFGKYKVSIYWYDEAAGQWTPLEGPQVDLNKGLVSGTVTHFTKFAVLTMPKVSSDPTDIKGHWAENHIRELIQMGAIQGYPDGTFGPNHRITRAEFAAVLVKAFQLEAKTGKVFVDTANHWAKTFIATAEAHGILTGYSQNSFGPDDPITREQMAAVMVRAAKLQNLVDGKAFADSGQISDWAKDSVTLVTANGLMNGYEDETFKPKRNASRAEAVTVILKAVKK